MIAVRGLAAIAVLGTAALAFHSHINVVAGTPATARAPFARVNHADADTSRTGRPDDSSRMLAAR